MSRFNFDKSVIKYQKYSFVVQYTTSVINFKMHTKNRNPPNLIHLVKLIIYIKSVKHV